MTPSLAIVALGSNLGDPIGTLRQAVGYLQELSVSPLLKSSLWRTPPVDCPPGSPDFVNAVVALAPLPGETPESLLGKLQELERFFGRRPKQIPNEPRPLDVDLIAFGQELRSRKELVVPHPRAHLRRFVLEPLAEILPDLRLAGQTRTISDLLQVLPNEPGMSRIEAGW